MIYAKLQKPNLPTNLIIKPENNTIFGNAPVMIVSSQAGSGKSTLVSQWLTTQSMPYVWYALDDWDNTLDQFLSYLAVGFKEIDPRISDQMLQLIDSRQTIDDDAMIRLITTLLQGIEQPFLVILDDYHHIFNPSIHQFMKTVINHFPPMMRLIIITREDPPLQLAKLRSQNKVIDVRMSSLRFTIAQTEALFEASLSKTLTAEQLTTIYERTEGWIAGIQLTALALQGIDDIDKFMSKFSESHYYIMDYLLEEVLEHHPAQIKAFLLQSSLFDYFSPHMCDEVLGLLPGDAKRIIKGLVRSNSFLNALESDEEQFRYHQLFRELLRKRVSLSEDFDPNIVFKKTGEWFERQGREQEAIDYYLNGACYESAAALIEVLRVPMDIALQTSSWLVRAKRLPEALIKRSPVLSFGYGWALLINGDTESCEPWFVTAQKLYDLWVENPQNEMLLTFDKEDLHAMPINLMNAKAYVATIKGDYATLMQTTEALRNLAETYSYNKQWIIEMYVAMAYWVTGELDPAIETIMMVMNGSHGSLNPLFRSSLVWLIAELYIQKGQLTKAQLLLEKAIDEVEREGTIPILLATYYIYLATIAAYSGETTLAFEHLERSKTYGHRFEFMDWRYKYNALLARLYIDEGLWDSARLCVNEGIKTIHQNPIPESFTNQDLDLWLRLAKENDVLLINRHIETILFEFEASGENVPQYTDEMKWKIVLNYALPEKYAAKLVPICERLIERAKLQKRMLSIIEFSLLLMRFTKSEAKCERLRMEANQLAESEGINLPFMEFASRKSLIMDESPKVKKAKANQSLPEPLTARELEILELMEKGHSNQEIANTLFIALNTVKSYNNNLFGKLEVSRRTEAIAIAKSLGLI